MTKAAAEASDVIGLAVGSDLKAVQKLAETAYAHFVPIMNARPLPMDADYGAMIDRGDVWVIRSPESGLAASLALKDEPGHLLIYSIAVDPAAQGKGYGRTLLEFALTRARQSDYGEVRLFTNVLMTGNRAWYQRHGFAETHIEQRGDKRICHMVRKL